MPPACLPRTVASFRPSLVCRFDFTWQDLSDVIPCLLLPHVHHGGVVLSDVVHGDAGHEPVGWRRANYSDVSPASRLGSAEQHAMRSRSAAQSTRSEQHCPQHVSFAWTAVALLSVHDVKVEGRLYVSPSAKEHGLHSSSNKTIVMNIIVVP